jgi:hypothetical protein
MPGLCQASANYLDFLCVYRHLRTDPGPVLAPDVGRSGMTIFHSHQDSPRDRASGSRSILAPLWQIFITRPRLLARLTIGRICGVLKIVHQAIVAAKLRRLRHELLLRAGARGQVCLPADQDIARDAARIPQRPLILDDKWDF